MRVYERLVHEAHLFDMDLERMNVELYKRCYLMINDFLEDIGKVGNNVNNQLNEGPERLFPAQARLTATKVSVQEFGQQL